MTFSRFLLDMAAPSFIVIGLAMSLRRRRLRLDTLHHAFSVIYLTFPFPKVPRTLFELRHRHWFAPRSTDSAVDGVLDDQGSQAVVLLSADELEDERMIL